MSSETMIMVRFGELSTKGRNKKDFIHQLSKNIKRALKMYQNLTYEELFDHIYVSLNGEDPHAVLTRMQEISGIHSLSLVKRVPLNKEEIIHECLNQAKCAVGKTFKIIVKRANKAFPTSSDTLTREIASLILKQTDLKVDVHTPDIPIHVEIRFEAAYVFSITIKGAGGYPLGSGGKVLLMLSGGIDSPVAFHMLNKRGLTVEAIHFASPPYTNSGVIEKIADILTKMNDYQPLIRLHVIRFTELQETIYRVSDESYAITLMRRMMYRLAEEVAKKYHCLAIANGESVGQVASQTLNSIQVINAVTNYPVLRPLISFDKEEIISIAKKIGTYDISIRPYEDCCTIFTPKNPKTKPSLEKVVYYENKFDYSKLIQEALDKEEIIYFKIKDNEI